MGYDLPQKNNAKPTARAGNTALVAVSNASLPRPTTACSPTVCPPRNVTSIVGHHDCKLQHNQTCKQSLDLGVSLEPHYAMPNESGRITGDSARQQTPYRCHSRNHGLLVNCSSCLRFAAARLLALSGLAPASRFRQWSVRCPFRLNIQHMHGNGQTGRHQMTCLRERATRKATRH